MMLIHYACCLQRLHNGPWDACAFIRCVVMKILIHVVNYLLNIANWAHWNRSNHMVNAIRALSYKIPARTTSSGCIKASLLWRSLFFRMKTSWCQRLLSNPGVSDTLLCFDITPMSYYSLMEAMGGTLMVALWRQCLMLRLLRTHLRCQHMVHVAHLWEHISSSIFSIQLIPQHQYQPSPVPFEVTHLA